MSSMRNAVQRRNHKERAQPEGRSKWGLLEKNKDYKLRAKDHKNKQKRLKILKEKAALANPDEFSFKMMSSRTKDGIKVGDRGNKALNHEVVQLLKTQDIGYVRTMLQRTRKEREKLEQEIQLANEGKFVALKSGKDDEDDEDAWLKDEVDQVDAHKITFVGSKEEQRHMLEDPEEEDMEAKAVPQKKLSKRQAEEQRQAEIAAGRARKKRAQQQEQRRELLDAVRKRENDLRVAEQELDLQRAKMNNSVGGVNKDGLAFKIRQRKR